MSREKIEKIKNKKIAILGLGSPNQALFDFIFKNKIECEITIYDSREEVKNLIKEKSIKWSVGKNYDNNLKDNDIVFRSPGYPLYHPNLEKARKAGVVITSPIKLFFELCPTQNIIGVTGTKGKGTTSSLIYEILKADKRRVFFGGNVGVPTFSFLEKIKKDDWVVLELSSFQLEDMEVSPRVAVITNFTREHLAPADPNNPNFHKTLQEYWRAKANIFHWQKEGDVLVVNQKLKAKIEKQVFRSEVIYFGKSSLGTCLPGEHNKENIAAAQMTARAVGVEAGIISQVVSRFKGLEYRIELIDEKEGVKYYNDSFATTPEAAITALKSFSEPVVLLVGGADKGSDFKQLAKEIKTSVKFAILLEGKATNRIKKELQKIKFKNENMKLVHSMAEAVKVARAKANPGEVVLMSPACASFGMFKNYKDRGKQFNKLVAH